MNSSYTKRSLRMIRGSWRVYNSKSLEGLTLIRVFSAFFVVKVQHLQTLELTMLCFSSFSEIQ